MVARATQATGCDLNHLRDLWETATGRKRETVLIKCTQYFLSVRNRPDRAAIRVEWIATAIANPLVVETQSDGRIRHWIWVEEVQRYLRVILLDDEETVHNAFFDRRFREE